MARRYEGNQRWLLAIKAKRKSIVSTNINNTLNGGSINIKRNGSRWLKLILLHFYGQSHLKKSQG